jgi:hypothetical protein
MRNTINKKIEKFISDHRNTKIVRNLFAANEARDRSSFVHTLAEIRECIKLQEKIEDMEQSIKHHSTMIREYKKEKNGYKRQLKQTRDGYVTKGKGDLFSEMELEIESRHNEV